MKKKERPKYKEKPISESAREIESDPVLNNLPEISSEMIEKLELDKPFYCPKITIKPKKIGKIKF